jgi:LAGLIDADG endonuclease
MQQTISENFNYNLFDTLDVRCILYTAKVKFLLNMKNSQVTKAFNNYKNCEINYNFFNSFVNRHKMKYLNIQLFNNKYYLFGINKFSTLSNLELNNLNPYYVTGFTDGEGCFLINIRPNSKMKTGYSVELVFKIALHLKDKLLLEKIKSFFGVGTITIRTDGYIQY